MNIPKEANSRGLNLAMLQGRVCVAPYTDDNAIRFCVITGDITHDIVCYGESLAPTIRVLGQGDHVALLGPVAHTKKIVCRDFFHFPEPAAAADAYNSVLLIGTVKSRAVEHEDGLMFTLQTREEVRGRVFFTSHDVLVKRNCLDHSLRAAAVHPDMQCIVRGSLLSDKRVLASDISAYGAKDPASAFHTLVAEERRARLNS